MNISDAQIRVREHTVCFRQQVVDLRTAGADIIQVVYIANVSRSNEVLVIPRNDEEWPAVGRSLYIKRVTRCTLKSTNNDVASFCAADKFFRVCRWGE